MTNGVDDPDLFQFTLSDLHLEWIALSEQGGDARQDFFDRVIHLLMHGDGSDPYA